MGIMQDPETGGPYSICALERSHHIYSYDTNLDCGRIIFSVIRASSATLGALPCIKNVSKETDEQAKPTYGIIIITRVKVKYGWILHELAHVFARAEG